MKTSRVPIVSSRPTAANALAIAVLVSMCVMLFPAAAQALCPDGISPDNTVVQADSNARGVRVDQPGMHIYNESEVCIKVSSLNVHSSDLTEFVEVGWYEDPAGLANLACVPDTTGAPRRLAFSYDDGVVDCAMPISGLAVGNDGFSVHDSNQNASWTYTHNTNAFGQSPVMGSFTNGIVTVNGERFSKSDTGRADFEGLDRLDPNGWVVWLNSSERPESDDEQFKPCKVGGDDSHLIVRLNSFTPCTAP